MQVQRDHGPLVRREASERLAQHGRLDWFGERCRELRPLDWTSAEERRKEPATGLADGLTSHDPIQPWTQAGGVADAAMLPPRSLERGLDGILGLIGITGNETSETHQARIVLVDE
jgi:hypothetical protein